MHGLKLRPEFQNEALKGTVIELKNGSNGGAIQQKAAQFLSITYPSVDLIKCLEAIAPGKSQSVVLMGGRGQGKSHMLATVFHMLTDSTAGNAWLTDWSARLPDPHLNSIGVRPGLRVIAETLTEQKYKNLWEILWAEHIKGEYYKGRFEHSDVSVPAKALLIEMLTEQPTALLLDEFQTWFDGLPETKQKPRRTHNFNFIQTLSEIAAEHPDKLLLVVSVRDGQTDAYQQLHRLTPKLVDFTDPLTKRDRHRLLLHRIFENRGHIPEDTIEAATDAHFKDYSRFKGLTATDASKFQSRLIEAWPFSPTLLDLLDEQVLIAVAAQETRDLIKLLVETFKLAGENRSVLTAADFRVDSSTSAVGSLLDAVASPIHRTLREKAQLNLTNVLETVPNPSTAIPHAAEIISALWLRSFNTEKQAGAGTDELQVDLTRDTPLDDNAFAQELKTIREASFNIHEQGPNWFVFKNEVNPDARLLASARNDRMFPAHEDRAYLARILHGMLARDDQQPYRVIVLPMFWRQDPWSQLAPEDHPDRWDNRVPIIVVPEAPDDEQATLGRWLQNNLSSKRNTCRFLLPSKGAASIYNDPDMVLAARAAKLASDWQTSEPEYRRLRDKYEKLLTEQLKSHFPRFAVLHKWHATQPSQCVFDFTAHNKQGQQIPAGIQDAVRETLFVPEDFDALVLDFATRGESVGKLLDELKEPRSGGKECIVWLGERSMIERVEELCAKGKIAVNLRGTQLVQASTGESEMAVRARITGKIGLGTHLFSTTLHRPTPAGVSGGGISVPVTGGSIAPIGGGSTPSPTPPTGGHSPTPANPFTPPSQPVVNEVPLKTAHLKSARNSPLNLTGSLETWGAQSAAVKLRNITLRLDDMNGQQLNTLLKKLPEGSYVLELDKEESF